MVLSTGSKPREELLYVISYLGGFSDSLAANMLQRVMGQIDLPRSAGNATAQSDCTDIAAPIQARHTDDA